MRCACTQLCKVIFSHHFKFRDNNKWLYWFSPSLDSYKFKFVRDLWYEQTCCGKRQSHKFPMASSGPETSSSMQMNEVLLILSKSRVYLLQSEELQQWAQVHNFLCTSTRVTQAILCFCLLEIFCVLSCTELWFSALSSHRHHTIGTRRCSSAVYFYCLSSWRKVKWGKK